MSVYGGTCSVIYPNKITAAQNRINKVRVIELICHCVLILKGF